MAQSTGNEIDDEIDDVSRMKNIFKEVHLLSIPNSMA
jgi:hypothetical protein